MLMCFKKQNVCKKSGHEGMTNWEITSRDIKKRKMVEVP